MTTQTAYGLIKRHSSLTQEEFSRYWRHVHAPLVIPWALANGCKTYVQIHNPRLSDWAHEPGNMPTDLDLAAWNGAGGFVFEREPGFEESARSKEYFQQVIEQDELRFLAGNSWKVARIIDPRLVEGEKVVLIEDGKATVDVGDAMEKFKSWIARDK
jgi:hypothetical protein